MAAPDFVSLFAGAGGLDHGLELAGWRCRYASDIDQDAVATLERNASKKLKRAFIERVDVRDLDGKDVLSKAGGVRGSIPLLAGGPPCQTWSSAGHQAGLADPRGRLFSDFTRIANEIDARWILFENVRGLLTARGPDGTPGSALQIIRDALLQKGFQTTVQLLNAADFGVPQRRVRLFIIGFRDGDEPDFPAPTHAKVSSPENGLLPWVTLRDCIDTVAPLSKDEIIRPSGKLAIELNDIPSGSGVKSPGKKETTRPGGHWGYKQGAFVADLDLAARTVTANGQQDWVRDPAHGLRRLCPRECAAIQTFPADWLWEGKNATLYRLIGNAVPPRLAENVGKALREGVEQQRSSVQVDTHSASTLAPLRYELSAAIEYTKREERANGASRRAAPNRRVRFTKEIEGA